MNVFTSIHEASKARNWRVCAIYTKDAIKEGKIIKWEISQTGRVDFAEWQAGEPPKFKVDSSCKISWSFWTVPTPARRVGNSWTGGHTSLINEGSTVTVSDKDVARFLEEMKCLTDT